MKAILEFDLNEQDDVYRHKCAVAAPDIVSALFEIDEQLRQIIKYDESKSDEYIKGTENAREIIREALGDHHSLIFY